jgi:hypothetical protein
MDIETQRAETSRAFLASYPDKWTKASRGNIAERHRLAREFIRHSVRYHTYMHTRPDAEYWISPLSRKEKREREDKKKHEAEEIAAAKEKGIELPKRMASDLYMVGGNDDEFELGYDSD